MPLNRRIPNQKYPYWIDSERCSVCGLTRAAWKRGGRGAYGAELYAPALFDEGVGVVRMANEGFEGGGGYRSRGPVLHAMHVIAESRWVQAHTGCSWAEGADDGSAGPVGVALAEAVVDRSSEYGADWGGGEGITDWALDRDYVSAQEVG